MLSHDIVTLKTIIFFHGFLILDMYQIAVFFPALKIQVYVHILTLLIFNKTFRINLFSSYGINNFIKQFVKSHRIKSGLLGASCSS